MVSRSTRSASARIEDLQPFDAGQFARSLMGLAPEAKTGEPAMIARLSSDIDLAGVAAPSYFIEPQAGSTG